MMRQQFIAFLSSQLGLTETQVQALRERTARFLEAEASVALEEGLLHPNELEEILVTESDGKTFIEIAIDKGYLTKPQGETLKAIQDMKDLVRVCQALLMEKIVDPEALYYQMSLFLTEWPVVPKDGIVRVEEMKK